MLLPWSRTVATSVPPAALKGARLAQAPLRDGVRQLFARLVVFPHEDPFLQENFHVGRELLLGGS